MSDLPSLLLAEQWTEDSGIDPTGYWISEKLDGMRAYWDGEALYSRNGNVVHAPQWFTEQLPTSMTLDGELWLGRGQFQALVSITKRHNADDRWRQVQYLVFDTVDDAEEPFEQRYKSLQEMHAAQKKKFPKLPFSIVEHRQCLSINDLNAELQRIVALGGEGLMLRQPGSLYVNGRSKTLLKVKRAYDAEARVVGHTSGTGRNKNRVGALLAQMANGTQFKIGSGLTDADRDAPPPIGSIVTYRFTEVTNAGVPRFPRFERVRDDMKEPRDHEKFCGKQGQCDDEE
jgi:DNA ligase-1